VLTRTHARYCKRANSLLVLASFEPAFASRCSLG